MLTAAEVKVLDKNAEFLGLPTFALMENAGKGVAEFIRTHLHEHTEILFFCGLGNNGGDGFVAARYLSSYSRVKAMLLGKEKDIRTEIAKQNFEKLKQTSASITDIDSLSNIETLLVQPSLVIDAMLGIGLSGALKEPYATIVQKINQLQKKTIVSIDVPTGLGTTTALHPQYTVTFHDLKEFMNKKNSGNIVVVDIGIPKKAQTYVGPGELAIYYPRPKKASHKGQNGRVTVIGGGPYNGAPALAALAALRTGCDLTYVLSPELSASIIASFSPNLIVQSLSSPVLTTADIPEIKKFLSQCDAVILGPGLGNDQQTIESIPKIVKEILHYEKPLVIDADAIHPLKEYHRLLKNSQTVVTPHAQEFTEFTGIKLPNSLEEKKTLIKEWAHKIGISIFLKGSIDILSNGTQIKLNDVHNEAMTVGGTGDVLSGIIGALLSKGAEPFNAMQIAAFINGQAGNQSYNKKSYGLLATDIIEEIPIVLKQYL